MRSLNRRPLVLAFFMTLIGAGAFWASSQADKPERPSLPKSGETVYCGADIESLKKVRLDGMGTFQPIGLGDAPPLVAVTGKPFISPEGLRTVPLRIIANGGHSFAEGIGETHFWLDATRPQTSFIQEKKPGTDFPAVQEMRFHFFYTAEAMPGRIFRSINPSVMRSDDVRAFPPPSGTMYRLMEPIELEDINEPGVVVGTVLSNRVVIPQRKPLEILPWALEGPGR